MQLLATVSLLATLASAYTVPDNLAQIYKNHKAGKCANKYQGGFSNGQTTATTFAYCKDIGGAIFLHNDGNGGEYTNMDVDCDGANRTGGKCANDNSGQDTTAFKAEVGRLNAGISDLDANLHPYIVFGNEDHSPSFRPQEHGMVPLSVMAVVCNNKLFYGVWGDTNGGTTTGEASMAMADICFPNEGLSGDNGHDPNDVLYIGFPTQDAFPKGAKWNARTTKEFQDSIKSLGDQLVAKLRA